MSDEGREELTRGEDFASFERRMMSLFDRMAERIEAETEESRRRDEELERRAETTQRNIDFIIQQQAKSDADMRELRELQKQNEEKWARTSEGINALLAIAEMHEREFFEMRQAQAEAQARTDAQIAEARARADARSAETGERLNALINTVERIISERRNGGGQKKEGSG
jgi:hypothetical protein